jgi:hypothetical protein
MSFKVGKNKIGWVAGSSSGPGGSITIVANYSALPAPATVPARFYWCSASEGTKWLPGSLGGTYYSAGLYYSNGVSWEYMEVPFQATQAEVNLFTNTDKFVTPATLGGAVYNYIVIRSNGVDGHRWKFTVGDDGMMSSPGEDLGV